MMITNLPMDLMEDIISRVPLKSMRAVRLTCKRWNTLTKSEIFANMHIGKAFAPGKEEESESLMIAMTEYNLYLMNVCYLKSVFVNNNDVNDLSAEYKGKLTCLDEQVKISHVFHCEGLLLCILKDDNTRVVVWNPYLGQTRWIQLRYPHVLSCSKRFSSGSERFHYGIGYEDKGSCRNYKILRFVDVYIYEEEPEFVWYEVYDFETGLWTTLDVKDPYWRITDFDGVTLKGNTYFCARKRDARDIGWGEQDTDIICFDYTRERFGPLLPLPNGLHLTLSCVRDEKLAVQSDIRYPTGFSYFITTMIEAEKVSWSQLLESDAYYSLADNIQIRLLFGGFYVEKEVAMFSGQRLDCHLVRYIGGDGFGDNYQERTRRLPAFKDLIWRKCVCCYVPSLVQIKQPKSGGQREKNQSDLEKVRYDKIMWRLSLFESRCKKLDLELDRKHERLELELVWKKEAFELARKKKAMSKSRSTSFLSTNRFASLAFSDDEE